MTMADFGLPPAILSVPLLLMSSARPGVVGRLLFWAAVLCFFVEGALLATLVQGDVTIWENGVIALSPLGLVTLMTAAVVAGSGRTLSFFLGGGVIGAWAGTVFLYVSGFAPGVTYLAALIQNPFEVLMDEERILLHTRLLLTVLVSAWIACVSYRVSRRCGVSSITGGALGGAAISVISTSVAEPGVVEAGIWRANIAALAVWGAFGLLWWLADSVGSRLHAAWTKREKLV